MTEQERLIIEAERRNMREACAKLLDLAAEHYDSYAAKYDDEDGQRAEIQAHTCRTQADKIRRLSETI